MKKFVCPVCGYVYEGDEIPEGFKCPVCHVDGSKFKEMDTTKLAAEHEFGIYEKTVRDNPDISEADKAYILEQLNANFTGRVQRSGYVPVHGPDRTPGGLSRGGPVLGEGCLRGG